MIPWLEPESDKLSVFVMIIESREAKLEKS